MIAKNLIISLCLLTPSLAQAIPAKGHQIMISTVSPQAVEVGKKIALKGGNVIDISVAVALTLSVTHPYYAALGGGGFAMVKIGAKDPVMVLDFREKAPIQTSPEFYLQKDQRASLDGGSAVAVPGIPAGLWALHKKYGKLPWSQLFSGPIQLAKKGFRVSGEWVDRTRMNRERFTPSGQKYFFKKDKAMYLPGELIQQKALARALKQIRKNPMDSFYKGRIAKDLVESVRNTGGILSLQDLKDYKVRWLKPLTTHFQGYRIYLMPPPSSGGVVIKSALALLASLKKVESFSAFSVDEFHIMGEVLNRSFRGRHLLGDPDYHKNPMDKILSESYLSQMSQSIHRDRSRKLNPLNESFGQSSDQKKEESFETTHLSVLDRHGNAVAMTLTLNGSYGSAVVSEKYGIALNNEMDDFTTRPNEPNMFGLIQGPGNQVESGKRPLSSMSPTLVEKDNKIFLVLGAPGGPTIISAVLQTIYRVLVTGLDIDMAIQAPRVHHQFLPHILYLDKGRFTPETIRGLKKRGHQVKQRLSVGRVYAVQRNKDGTLEAAYDSRSEGACGGY